MQNRNLFPFLSLLIVMMTIGHDYTAQGLYIRSFDTSCKALCNGSAELLGYVAKPERYYTWRAEDELRYTLLDNPVIDELCAGKYSVRQVDIDYEVLRLKAFVDDSITDFNGLARLEMSSIAKRELTVILELDQIVDHLNYYLKATYSLDDTNWIECPAVNQSVKKTNDGQSKVRYKLNLPSSCHNKKHISVRLYRRNRIDELSDQVMYTIKSAELESKFITEYPFEIRIEEHMQLRGMVSNEIDGQDGYIDLEISGGLPPYTVSWNDGPSTAKRSNLSAGNYKVVVSDMKGCNESATYNVAPTISASGASFDLIAVDTVGTFNLSISNLYRQPLTLDIIDAAQGAEVKQFKINPLYDDLSMPLDLSFLGAGTYRATLSTDGYSKNVDIKID